MKHTKRFAYSEGSRSAASQGSSESECALPDWAENMVDSQPLACVGAAFAVGIAAGLGIVALAILPGRSVQPQPKRMVRDFGNRVSESISRAIPNSVSEYWTRAT